MNKRDQELWEQALHDGERTNSPESCFADLIRADERKVLLNALDSGSLLFTDNQLDELLNKIRVDEREACAKVCEQPIDEIQITDTISEVVYMDAHECAAGIRARGNT